MVVKRSQKVFKRSSEFSEEKIKKLWKNGRSNDKVHEFQKKVDFETEIYWFPKIGEVFEVVWEKIRAILIGCFSTT